MRRFRGTVPRVVALAALLAPVQPALALASPSAQSAPSGRAAQSAPAERIVRSSQPPREPAPPDRWWRDRALLPALGLPPAQLAALESTYQSARERLEALDRQAMEAEAAFSSATHAAQPDAAALARTLDSHLAARHALEIERMRLLLTMRNQLSPEQWHRLREIQSDPRRAMPGEPVPPGPRPRGFPPEPGPGIAPGPGNRPGRDPGMDLRPRAGPRLETRPGPGPGPGLRRPPGARPGRPGGPPLPPGLWWREPFLADRLGLAEEQRLDLDRSFAARRDALESARAALEREERDLGPRLAAEPLDLTAAMAQVERVSQARAALERALLELRLELWQKLTPAQREHLLEIEGPAPAPGDGPSP